ncbi:peptidase C39 family protein [Candidatus Woesearchaeota archaeon]|nr:peptidase C39 family protein [Candidatus Woesearchaeota archaeon]
MPSAVSGKWGKSLLVTRAKPVVIPVPYYGQETEFTCGPAVLKMVLHYNGEYYGERRLRKYAQTSPLEGTNHEKMIRAARTLGYHCFVRQNAAPRDVKRFINKGYPVIINWQEPDTQDGHYSVLFGYLKAAFLMHDPYRPQRKIIPTRRLLPLWHDGGQYKWFMIASRERIPLFMTGKTYLPL